MIEHLARKIGLVLGLSLLIFLGGGYLIASETTRQWVETLWLAWLMGLAGLSLAAVGLGLVILFGYARQRYRRIFPDENGNLPLIHEDGRWLNGNLVGVEQQPHAWMVWQATNNRSTGTPARELFSGGDLPRLPSPAQLPFISAPGQSEVIDAIAKEVLN